MKLVNCLIVDAATQAPYTYKKVLLDAEGNQVPALGPDGQQLKDAQGNQLFKAEVKNWTLFDIWLKLVGQNGVQGWIVEDISLYFKVSNKLRRLAESAKPIEEQSFDVKPDTLKWIRQQLADAMKLSKEMTVELAATVLAGLDGCIDAELEGEI